MSKTNTQTTSNQKFNRKDHSRFFSDVEKIKCQHKELK